MAKITTPDSLYGNSRDILREAERENEILADIAGEEYESPGDIPKGKYVIEKRLLDAAQKKNELLEAIVEGSGGGSGAAKAIGIDYATDIISLKNKDGDVISGSGATLPAYGVSFDPTTGGLTLTKNGTAVQGQTVTIPNYGSPVGVTSSSDMTDHDTIYLYAGTTSGSYTNGHFYYWDGSAWADGGEYAAATVQTDKTLLVEDRAADAKATGEAVGELKTQLDNITNEKNYQAEVYQYYAKVTSGVGRTINESSNYRSTIIPVVDGRHYKIEALGRGNRNIVYGIADTSWGIGTVLTDLNYVPQIDTGTDNITIEITPNGYHFLFITFAYSTQSEYPYSFIVKVTETTNNDQFAVNGVEVPTYEQFEEAIGEIHNATDELSNAVENITSGGERTFTEDFSGFYASGSVNKKLATDTNGYYRTVIFPVKDGNSYKVVAYGRGNRNFIYGIATETYDVGTSVVDLDTDSRSSDPTDNITVEIAPEGYNYLMVLLAYSQNTESYPYQFSKIEITETLGSGQFTVNGVEVPTYDQFENVERSIAPRENVVAAENHHDGELIMVNDRLVRVKGEITAGDTISTADGGNAEFVDIAGLGNEYFHTEQINLVYRKDITPGKTIASTGELTDNSGFSTTGFIEVIPGNTYSISSRRRLAWYYADKSLLDYQAESESGPATVIAPQDAKYLRFAYANAQTPMPMCNEGDVLLQFDETENRLKPEYYAGAKRYRLETSTMSISSGPFSDTHHLAVLAGQRIDYKDGKPSRTLGYLLADPVTQKMYSADANLGSITYLCDWKNPMDTDWVPTDDPYRAEMDSGDDPYMKNWLFNVTADGDILCMRKRGRRKPILYPHGDYDHPVMIDVSQTVSVWGGDYTLQGIRPASELHSPMLVCFDDGDIIFGDYKIHSVTEYNNHEPRCIWKVTKPYTTPGNWTVPHAFNHATGTNSSTPTKHNQSTDPDNDIGHIHTTVYDWYSKLVYVTTGDYDEHCRVWVSSDFGDTWDEEASIAPEPIGNGQIYRSVSVVFTKDAMWYGTDSGPETHKLIKVPRDANGVPDFDQLEIVAELERGGQTGGQAVYSNILTRDPPGILFVDRGQHRTDTKLQIPWYSFEDEKIYFIAELDAIPNSLSSLTASNGLCQDFYNMYQAPELDYQLIGGIGGKSPTNPNNIDILGNGDNLITNSSGNVTGIYNPVGLIKMRIVPELSVT